MQPRCLKLLHPTNCWIVGQVHEGLAQPLPESNVCFPALRFARGKNNNGRRGGTG